MKKWQLTRPAYEDLRAETRFAGISNVAGFGAARSSGKCAIRSESYDEGLHW